MKRLFLLLSAVLAFSAAVAQTITMTVDGTERRCLLYVPQNLGQGRPLLISCHGMNQDAAYLKSQLAIESVADTAKFLTVFPEGIDRGWDISGQRDLRFMQQIIDTMAARYGIDRNRVYLSGFSMGGMFTYHAMNQMSDRIAAFAPISGYPMGGATATSSRPVPLIHTHGTGDDVVNYGGVEGTLKVWVQHNGCNATPTVTKPYKAAHVTRKVWSGGQGGTEVVLMELADKGHWISNDVVHTGNEIWLFCSRYTLDLHDPEVHITSPADGTAVTTFGTAATGSTLRLAANAYDPDGTVASVAFYDGETLLADLTAAPYQYTWTDVPAGEHTVRAVVTDDEGRTAQDQVTVRVEACHAGDAAASLTAGFPAAGNGSVPAGWTVSDGQETRTGPASGFSAGCRLFRLTGTPRDFDYGLYVRNVTGDRRAGHARYAAAGASATLRLGAGLYRLTYKVATWSRTDLPQVTAAVEAADGAATLASLTAPTTSSVGNAASGAFSGTAERTLFFRIAEGTDARVSFYTQDAAWADLILGEAALALLAEGDGVADALARLQSSLAEATALYAATAGALYDGAERTELAAAIAAAEPLATAAPDAALLADYAAAVDRLDAAVVAMRRHMDDVDATETLTVIYQSDFPADGPGVLPAGWVTFDGSERRVGPLTGLYSGARILEMTGTPRDFDCALYIRNIDGRASEGFARYGSAEGSERLTLAEGTHHLSYTVCNWNRSAFGPIRMRLLRNAGGAEIVSRTVTPSCNIGNSGANPFSGSTRVELDFEVSAAQAGAATLEFLTEDAGWADAIIADILLTRSDYGAAGIGTVAPEASAAAPAFFDLHGRRLDAAPAQGLYIERSVLADGTAETKVKSKK